MTTNLDSLRIRQIARAIEARQSLQRAHVTRRIRAAVTERVAPLAFTKRDLAWFRAPLRGTDHVTFPDA